MMEAGVVLTAGRVRYGTPHYWHAPKGRSCGALPDSRDLWEVMWEVRGKLSGFAHSHPGGGLPGPSSTDLSTFSAIEAGLGVRLAWWIISEDWTVLFTRNQRDKSLVEGYDPRWHVAKGDPREPVWVPELRRLSYYGR